ncbi:MAG: copper amine oxidase N-terminal domain-containing protein [Fimbriimonadaceae bacterium]
MRLTRAGLAAVCLVGSLLATAQGGRDFRITVDGKPVSFNGPGPRRKLGRFLVPLRGIFEKMGAHVRWDDDSQTVFANRNDTKVELTIGSNNATVNGDAVLMDVPAQLINGSTFVPLRFLSETLGARVDFDGPTRSINIRSGYPHRDHVNDPIRSVGAGGGH